MSLEQIDGFVPLSHYDDRSNKSQEHSNAYKRVREGIEDGSVLGLQCGKSKRWIVNKRQADALLASHSESRRTPTREKHSPFRGSSIDDSRIEAAVVALCEINNGITLMQATIERLTTAVESIATQPKTTHDNALATVAGGNGFHN